MRVGIEFQIRFAAIPRGIYFLMEKEGAFRLIAKENALIAYNIEKQRKECTICDEESGYQLAGNECCPTGCSSCRKNKENELECRKCDE